SRHTAIKLLEGDEEIRRDVMEIDPEIISTSERLAGEIESIHGHSCSTVITSERYEIAGEITREVQKITVPKKTPLRETIHTLTTHRILGYPIMIASVLSIFFIMFTFGDFFSGLLNDFFYGWQSAFESLFGEGIVSKLLWGGIIEGIIAGITVALPYIAPFYFILYLLEDSGYLSRIAFLMDKVMHKIGLHGKAFIPLILGYGWTVPACLGCRIMETEREHLLTGFITTLVPCAARTVVILGLVGTFVGLEWALAIYIFNLCIIFILGKIASKVLPGEPTALIMEMNEYRVPHFKTVAKQAWFRLEEFIKSAFPLMIIGSFLIKLLDVFKLLDQIALILSPITVTWLGLPMIAGVTLIFGVLRKELTLIMLATLLGTTNFGSILTPIQMVVFTLVTLFYIPCISTIAVLVKEFGYKNTLFITVVEIVFAILLGGIVFRLLPMLGIL
ncbi:ferrous iron transport protein B, partial [Candidatus Bathyarchaeota archaeon]